MPDCAHVVAARRLIGRYKGEGSKEDILSCINRKAKAMGCDTEKKDAEEVQDSKTYSDILCEVFTTLEDEKCCAPDSALTTEEFAKLQNILNKIASLVGKDTFAAAAAEEKLGLDISTEDAYCDQVVALEEKIGELNDHLSALQEEFNLRSQDLATLQDEIVEEKLKTRSAKEKTYKILKTLSDKDNVDLDFSDMEITTIDNEIERLDNSLDFDKITTKLNDGMSRNPQGIVDDPTIMQDNDNSGKRNISPAEMQRIQESSMMIAFTKGPGAAKQYVDKCLQGIENRNLRNEDKEE